MAKTSTASKGLNVGPVPLNERIDPSDPDLVGNLSGPQGAMYDSAEIIRQNAEIYAKLGPVLSLPPDLARSRALDHEEIAEVTGVPIEGASVRGTGETAPRVVVYITRATPEGRSSKGMVPYDELPKSKKAYEGLVEQEQEVALAARKVSLHAEQQFGEDPRVSVLRAKIAELEREKEAQESSFEERLAALESRDAPDRPAEVPEEEQDNDVKSTPPAGTPASEGASADALTDEQIDDLKGEDLDKAVEAAGIDASQGGSLSDGGLNAAEKRDALKARRT